MITGPAAEPVTADDVKARARIDGTEFDSQIALLIPALRADAENRLGRRLITQTVELVLDAFPSGEIDLRLLDVRAITSVKYLDSAAAELTLDASAYSLDARSAPESSWLLPAYGVAWPSTLDAANAVRVRYTVGYGDAAADVPAPIRYWIIARVAAELGADATPFVDRLLDPFKVY
jgi:uncharacterized phiE125 gp8 family phage protein